VDEGQQHPELGAHRGVSHPFDRRRQRFQDLEGLLELALPIGLSRRAELA